MKLGILVVYLISPEDDWILKIHLERLARTKPFIDFKLYAAANRLPDRYQSMLRNHAFIEIINLPSIRLRMNAEHGSYLDMLATHAVKDGCDYICTFDVDSWPIHDNWIEIVWNLLERNRAVGAAILRAENGDTILPHPSFSFIDADLFRRREFRFWMKDTNNRDVQKLLSEHDQRQDTGFGIAYYLRKHNLNWVELRRSNINNYHYLMGGIYGNLIFHLGGGSRTKVFAKDETTWAGKVTAPLASVPVIWRYKNQVQKLLETLYEPKIHRKNRYIFDAIGARLRSNETEFYRYLTSGSTPTPVSRDAPFRR